MMSRAIDELHSEGRFLLRTVKIKAPEAPL